MRLAVRLTPRNHGECAGSPRHAERSRIDDSHPATLLRLQLLEALPPASARVVLDPGRAKAIDAEIARPLQLTAKHAGDHIRYRR